MYSFLFAISPLLAFALGNYGTSALISGHDRTSKYSRLMLFLFLYLVAFVGIAYAASAFDVATRTPTPEGADMSGIFPVFLLFPICLIAGVMKFSKDTSG